jgi:hypothetical protein
MANSSCSVCSGTVTYSACSNCIASAQHELEHGSDGPITSFVLIARATRLAASGKFGASEVANALAQALEEYGYTKPVSAVYATGS